MGMPCHDPTDPDRCDMMEPSEWCPRGFFADARFETMGSEWLGGSWPDDEGPDSPPRDLAAVVSERASLGEIWGWKCSHGPWIFPHFLKAYAGGLIRVVLTIRSPEKAAASWDARYQGPYCPGRMVVGACQKQINRIRLPHSTTVDFDRMVNHPEIVCRELAEFAGVKFNPKAVDLVDPALRRF